jgi:hypothetical protein
MQILVPIVEAVAFAHGRGVVHRDIKPENVFLARTGSGVVPKLLDFGISHVAAESAAGARMTATGAALGTPAYMAPEQIKSARNVDARSDVWALGVLLHETLSGQLPFKGETVADHFVQIATADPIPLEVAAPHAPRAVGRIVARCLRRSPVDRYQNAGTLLSDLEAVAAGSRPSTKHLPPPVAEPRHEATTAVRLAPSGPESLEIQPLSAPLSAQGAGHAGPAGRVARFHSLRAAPAEGTGERWIVGTVATAAALAAAGMVAAIDPWPDDWALGAQVAAFIGGLGPNPARGFGLVCIAAAGATALRGWRLAPRSIGHLIAAVAGFVLAIVTLSAASGATPAGAVPWAVAGAVAGLGAVALRRATDSWVDDVRGDAVLAGAAAAAAFVVARWLVR